MDIYYYYDQDGPARGDAAAAIAAWAGPRGHALAAECATPLKPCNGCFGCWLKTPGRCVLKGDAGEAFLESFVRADLVILGGETPYGSFALPIKAALDRALPCLLPYFRRFRGEMHHVPRYPRLPRILSVAFGEAVGGEEEIHLELVRAFCDNVASPRQKRAFRYGGDAAALAAWLDEEVAA
jgi:hypothetical protein